MGVVVAPLKVCFVSPYSYSLFNQSTSYIFGGSEVRAWLFSRGLARRPDFDVSFIVFDHGQPEGEVWDGIRMLKQDAYRTFEETERRAGKRSIEWQAVWKAIVQYLRGKTVRIGERRVDTRKHQVYKGADADVFVAFGVHNMSAELIAYAHAAGKRVVLFSGSDIDFSEEYMENSYATNMYGNTAHFCYYAITRANLLVTQTFGQADLCRDRFGRQPDAVISNPIELSDPWENDVELTTRRHVLWVGKSDTTKRPELLLEIARDFPNEQFFMVLNRSNGEIFDQTMAARPANVEIVERLPYSESDALYRDAIALVNTSRFEGFPNTFLQAGKFGVPIMSLAVDPDRFIEKRDCGIIANGDLKLLIKGIGEARGTPDTAARWSRNVRRYVEEVHDLERQVTRLGALLESP